MSSRRACAACLGSTRRPSRWPACLRAAPGPPAERSRPSGATVRCRRWWWPATARYSEHGSSLPEESALTTTATPEVHVLSHPLVQHKLTLMRQKDRSTSSFRRLLGEIGMLMAYEVTRDMPTQLIEIEPPLATMRSPVIEGRKTVFVAILRAGTGFLDGMLEVIPGARVGHVGLYRDPKTLVAVEYYFKMPHGMHERDAIVLDPMLATGNSAVAAVDRLKETRPRSIRFVCLLAAPEGIKNFPTHHAEVPIYTAAIDDRLNDHGYIVPGLGDAGDRIFGTK